MPDHRLLERDRQWQRKPALRTVYVDLYRRIAAATVAGRVLEVGAGTSGFKEFASGVIASDVLFAPWLDVVAGAEHLPFRDGSFGNIVMFDVLHHLPSPAAFFAEASRLLTPGGRVVMVEPAITPVSWPFYRFFHDEPLHLRADPLVATPIDNARDPFDANQAIPTLLFVRQPERFAARFPALSLVRVEWLSLLAYPLTGGFRSWSLIPARLVEPLLRVETRLLPAVGRLMAFRLLAVVERRMARA